MFWGVGSGDFLRIDLTWFRNAPLFLQQAYPCIDFITEETTFDLDDSNAWSDALGRMFFTRHVAFFEKF